MSEESSAHRPAEDDKAFVWHPFTPMRQWCAPDHEPLFITRGEGCWLWDLHGNRYLDGNSSIWTNIHGHNHPKLNAAIKAQLDRVAHTSFLGYSHEPAVELARQLIGLFPSGAFAKVFYSDNGSTAVESAVRMALQYWRQNGRPKRDLVVAFDAAYHGDTLGAASLGGLPVFKGSANQFGYDVLRVKGMDDLAVRSDQLERVAAVIIEPLVQGAAGMKLWPPGMLQQIESWCREHDTFLILDEVMTGFGRTGRMFACEHENVSPDFLCLAKGLTGGYLPLAVTLTTQRVFDGFLGEIPEGRTFYYGHSYTASQLGCAAALASLVIFREEQTLDRLQTMIHRFSQLLRDLLELDHVVDVRQCGFIAGIEIAPSKDSPQRYAATDLMGAKVCLAARSHGLLTRPILDTIVLMPPLCASEEEMAQMVSAVRLAIGEVCGGRPRPLC